MQAMLPTAGRSIEWFFRGARNDATWLAAPAQQKMLYELSQTALPAELFKKLPQGNSFSAVVIRGQSLLDMAGGNWLKAFASGSLRESVSLVGTGPTPVFRFGPYVVAGAAVGCGVNQSCRDSVVDSVGSNWEMWTPGQVR